MTEREISDRNFYKSIVTGMSICIPIGIGFGIACDNIILGLSAGNIFGILLGILINMAKQGIVS